MSKSDYRTFAKNLRKTFDTKVLSTKAVDIIRNLEEYKAAEHVMIYYPIEYEIDFRGLLRDKKNFYLPKVCGGDLSVCPYCNKLIKSDLNIFEPCTKPVSPNVLDFIVVPALMADSKNYRLGYGGGFYDKFLPECKNAFSVCVVEKSLYVEKLQVEKFDFRLNKVIVV